VTYLTLPSPTVVHCSENVRNYVLGSIVCIRFYYWSLFLLGYFMEYTWSR